MNSVVLGVLVTLVVDCAVVGALVNLVLEESVGMLGTLVTRVLGVSVGALGAPLS
jgi:hypothetical protein